MTFFSRWSYATKDTNINKVEVKTHVRESLSNILLTHIDFQRPTLDYKRYHNLTKDDETIEKVPESCIEEFNLYVSTWKGWQGVLPSKDNKVTWEQVERDNTIQGTVSCTHVANESIENLQDFYDNETNSSSPVPPIPIAESFRY
jgi:hypothetical protein